MTLEEKIRAAVERGNTLYWEDGRKQEADYRLWETGGFKEEGPDHMKGDIIDYITREVLEALKEN